MRSQVIKFYFRAGQAPMFTKDNLESQWPQRKTCNLDNLIKYDVI